jgi:Tfp pilus assembly protein PilX
LLAVITLLGITGFLLSSTDVKIGGNFRTNQGALEAAMAGAERGREQLRYANSVSAVNNASFSDDLAARVGPNAVLNGYAAGTDDVALTSGTVGSYSYTAYLTNDSADGLSNQTDTNQRVLITSVATGPNSSKAQVQIVVTFDPGPQIPAPVYTKGVFTGNGSSLAVSGNDNCTPPAPSLPPIYTKTPGYTDLNGTPTFTGSPSTPQQGSLDVDISTYIEQLKVGATVLTADQTNANFGSSTNFVTIYSDTSNPVNANGLKIQNGTGYGLLLVKGDLELGGGFNWNGVVLVTGTVTFNGGGGPNAINIRGAILSTQSVSANGDITVLYDSCMLKKSFHSKPLKIVTWKHVY